jgi:putative peptidoglycan lipid II flippase
VTLPSVWRLRLRWRPALRFPPGVFGRAGGLALVGLVEFVAADVYSVITIDLANGHGNTGAIVLVNYANLVFTAMCSVLPLAVIISAFPVLAAAEGDAFDRTSAGSTRAVVLMCWLSTAIMIAVAVPAAHILVHSDSQVTQLTEGFLLFAPGISGFGLVTNLSRVMFAMGKVRAAGIGLVAQQLLPALLSVPLVLLAPPRFTVAGLALASSAGMLVLNVPMVAATRRLRGPAAVAGVGRAELAGVAAAAAGAAAGLTSTLVMPTGGGIYEAGTGVVAAALAVAVFGAVAYALDRDDMRAAAGRLRRRLRSR